MSFTASSGRELADVLVEEFHLAQGGADDDPRPPATLALVEACNALIAAGWRGETTDGTPWQYIVEAPAADLVPVYGVPDSVAPALDAALDAYFELYFSGDATSQETDS